MSRPFILICLTIFTSMEDVSGNSGITEHIQFNKCLPVSYMHVKFGDSLDNCVEECVRRPACKSLNYRRKTHLCELLPINSGQSVPLISSAKCVHLDIRVGDQLLIQTNSPCSMNDCLEGETCNLPNSPNCLITECPDLTDGIDHGHLLGNVNTIGSARIAVCETGYKMFGSPRMECSVNGSWTHTSVCGIPCGVPVTVLNGHVTSADIFTPNALFSSNDSNVIFSQKIYLNGSWIEFSCENEFVLRGTNITQCLNGNWTEVPKCIVPGIGQVCVDSSDCTVPVSECIGGTCRCLSQRSYSYGSKSCVYDCKTFADTFQYEIGKKLNFKDDESHYMYNYTACKQRCLEITSFTCQSFEVSSSLCLISSNNANDGLFRDADDFIYYQRDCLT
jgi:hypothetical protein